MKFLYKPLLISLSSIIILFSNLSGSSSNWSGMSLTPDEMENSVKFQLSRGGNCKGEFEKLTIILDRFISNGYPSSDLINILGNPNSEEKSINTTVHIYNLTPISSDCNVRFEIKDDKLTNYTFLSCK